jgi:signal transduction histidine kinase
MRLLQAGLTQPEHRDLVAVALNNVDHLGRLVSDILDAAKIETGAVKLQRRTMTVQALGEAAIENVRSIAAAARVRLAIDVKPGVRAVHVDVDRMVQAIVSLLSNAIKFAPTGSTVTFGARSMADGGVAMTVHDAGDGIPPERLHRLFQKSSQPEPGSTNPEKGPGLSMTRALVEDHGGSVHVVSTRELGTTFEIRLGGDGTSFAKVTASSQSDA